MVPRALEQYVTQLAEKGPGSLAANMPKVSSPKVLREASEERLVSNRASNRYGHFSIMYYIFPFSDSDPVSDEESKLRYP